MPDSNRQYPVRVDIRLTEEERDSLNLEAVQRGITRQELLRARILTSEGEKAPIPPYKPVHLSRGRDAIDKAVDAITRRYHFIPRHQLEPIVCTVICALSAINKKAS